jgi:hypothetical protein
MPTVESLVHVPWDVIRRSDAFIGNKWSASSILLQRSFKSCVLWLEWSTLVSVPSGSLSAVMCQKVRLPRRVNTVKWNGSPVSCYCYCCIKVVDTRAKAQAVSRRSPTAAARILDRGESDVGSVVARGSQGRFSPIMLVSLPISFPPISSQSSSIIQAWYDRPTNGLSTSGVCSNPAKRKVVINTCWLFRTYNCWK